MPCEGGCTTDHGPFDCLPYLRAPVTTVRCPCQECIVKMICSNVCEEWDKFWNRWCAHANKHEKWRTIGE
jgi:hypothetical protein